MDRASATGSCCYHFAQRNDDGFCLFAVLAGCGGIHRPVNADQGGILWGKVRRKRSEKVRPWAVTGAPAWEAPQPRSLLCEAEGWNRPAPAVVPIILDVLRIPRASKDPRCFPGTGRDGSSTFFGRTLRMGKWLTCSPMKQLWYTCGRKRNGVPYLLPQIH